MSGRPAEQSDIMRKNVAALAGMQRKALAARSLQGRAADAITDFDGSMTFVYVHAGSFGLWILLNVPRDILGHSSRSITGDYTHASPQEMGRAL